MDELRFLKLKKKKLLSSSVYWEYHVSTQLLRGLMEYFIIMFYGLNI